MVSSRPGSSPIFMVPLCLLLGAAAPSFSVLPSGQHHRARAAGQRGRSLATGAATQHAAPGAGSTLLGASLAVAGLGLAVRQASLRRAAEAEAAAEASVKEDEEEKKMDVSEKAKGDLEVSRGAVAKKKAPAVFDATKQPGACDPLGYWDPLGFCPVDDRIQFRKLRTAELKHGRVAMLASVGLLAQHYIRFPTGTFDDVPNGLWAPISPWGGLGCCFIVWVAIVLEFVVWAQDPQKEIGDFGDPLGIGMDSTDMRNREINNGRFAMFATMGILIAEAATGKDAVEQFGL